MALFSVCADEELTAALALASGQFSGLHFAGGFGEYLGAKKRPHFSQAVKSASLCAVVIDMDVDRALALETVASLRATFQQKAVIAAISSQLDPENILQAMRAGCNEYFQRPIDAAVIVEFLSACQSRLQDPDQAGSRAPGRVLSFLGAKGGVGSTTLAVHLAYYLALQHRKKTLLIDHRHQLGHVSLLLGVKDNSYHFDELIRNVDRLDADLLAGFVARHASGLDVLGSPDTCATRSRETRGEVEQVIDFLRKEYEYVLIDSSPHYEEGTSAVLGHSDEVYLVSTPDLAALRDLSRHVEYMTLNESVKGKLKIVLNRSSSADAVSAEQIEKAICFPVSVKIANNYIELLRAIDAGEPIGPNRRSEFTQQISKWASKVVSADEMTGIQKPAKKGFAFWK